MWSPCVGAVQFGAYRWLGRVPFPSGAVGRHAEGLRNHEFTVTDPHVRAYGDTAIVEAVQRQKTTAMGRDTSGRSGSSWSPCGRRAGG